MKNSVRTALITAGVMAVPLVWQVQRAADTGAKLEEYERRNQAISNTREEDHASRSGASQRRTVVGKKTGHKVDGLSDILREGDPAKRLSAFDQLLQGLTTESAAELSEYFAKIEHEMGGQIHEDEYRRFLRAWARLDGQSAIESCRSPNGELRASGETMAALAGWAQTDPERARQWFEALEEGRDKQRLGAGLIDGWAIKDFEAASIYASTLPESGARSQLSKTLLKRAMISGGVSEAQRWFTSISDTEDAASYKREAFDNLIEMMVNRSAEEAAGWVSSLGRQSYMKGESLVSISAKYATDKPEQALRWLDSLGPGTAPEAFSEVAKIWSEKNPAEAGAWLQSNQSHPAYESMVGQYAGQIAFENESSARSWADRIQDPRTREQALRNINRATGAEEFNPGPISVSPTKVSQSTSLQSGQTLQVSYEGRYYAAQVVKTEGSDNVHIRYFGWGSNWDEIVPRSDLRIDPNARQNAVKGASARSWRE